MSPQQRASAFFFASFLLCEIHFFSLAATADVHRGNVTDLLALLAFRDQITNSHLSLSSWNNTLHFCQWEGVTCSKTVTPRITSLSLESRKLIGTLHPHLHNLTHLQELDLGDNSLRGSIPPELGSLTYLRTLNLSSNSLDGEIPSNLSNCKELNYLNLGNNSLVGEVPTSITSLSKMELLRLQENKLTGRIPPSIGNFSVLRLLALGSNNLYGSIPATIGLLTRLNFLQIAENQLTGAVPQSLYNLSSLTFLAFATNQLQGSLPPTLGLMLPKLETLYVGGNRLTGAIPASILNASGLINIDFAENNFTGPIPSEFGRLGGLEWLNFEGNQLGTGGKGYDLNLINSLSNCTNLQVLDLDSNRFGGLLPESIANLSTQLSMLMMGNNQIYGSVPESINNLVGLTVMSLEKNLLTGQVPATIGGLQNLQVLSLYRNRLSGTIPLSIGNLTQLTDLRLMDNSLQGGIPATLGNCTKLLHLDLSQNQLDGTIPEKVISVSSLSIRLSLAQNKLIGSLPKEIAKLKNLGELDISENRLSGEIPQELGDCESIIYLRMQGNLFSGSIPSTLSNLKGIEYIDLARNKLSGYIPTFLQSFQFLKHINLSYNDFEGPLPEEGVFRNASAVSVQGNANLCGGVPLLKLSICTTNDGKNSTPMRVVVPVVCAASGLSFLFCLFATLYCRRNKKKRGTMTSLSKKSHVLVSYREILKATHGFSPSNLIGEGSFGTVYTGKLDNIDEDVAVKVLNLENQGAFKSFIAECEALREIKHRNLVKILTVCSSVDSNGNDFKALVYELMPNGNLDEWLHPKVEEQENLKFLNILQRLNISVDVAAALDYLHHQCQFPVVHCDLKPSNVLLDEDMGARVSDFGLAKIILTDTEAQIKTVSIGIKGSIGYIPPEYGEGAEVSVQGDVYSYGILMLEMFTGIRPTDDNLCDGITLHDFVKMTYPQRTMEIIDPLMFSQGKKVEGITGDISKTNDKIRECLLSLIGIGLSCSTRSPRGRMKMMKVVAQMHAIRSTLLNS